MPWDGDGTASPVLQPRVPRWWVGIGVTAFVPCPPPGTSWHNVTAIAIATITTATMTATSTMTVPTVTATATMMTMQSLT